MKLAFAAAAVALCLGSNSAFAGTSLCNTDAQNQVLNCGFETGDTSDWTFSGAAAVVAQSNLYGVDNSNPNSGTYEAYFGTQGATLGTHLTSDDLFLSQNIALTESLTYTISFYYAQDTNIYNGYTNYFAAIWDGTTIFSQTAANATNGYVYETFTVTGSASGANTLTFASQNDAGFWFLDDISVDEVPEPASLAMFGVGLFGLAALRRRTRAVR